MWVAAWALVPWANLAVLWAGASAGWAPTSNWMAEVLNRAAVSFAVLLSIWGAARVSAELERLRASLFEAVEQDRPDVDRLFRGVDSRVGPLALTAIVAVALPLDEALAGDAAAAILQGATWLLIGIPLSTAAWVYAVLQLGLDRLGRGHLTLKPYQGDRTLGLQPVGSLAFTGFWMLFGAVTPLVLTGFSDLPTVTVGTIVLAGAVVLFFLSLRGLHWQMAAIRRQEMERAAALYKEAYIAVMSEPTLEVLQQQTAVLNAAENVEKRAERIQAWPFDEATFTRVATIATSATATIVARFLLAPTGL